MEESISQSDSAVYAALRHELQRQQETLVLIPSENYASPAVLDTQCSVLTNKYAEGYPKRRYYQGCASTDTVEALACRRARELFGADHANVQPHSGTQANIAVYHALLEPGDTILSLDLAQGGHLSHGKQGTLPYACYHVVHYGLDRATERFDFAQVENLVRQHHPRMIVVGGSAYPRKIEFEPWREFADAAGAYLLADMAHIAGLIAAGVHPNPFPLADVVTATTQKTLRGPRGGFILCRKEFSASIDKAVFPGTQGGPFVNVIAAKAVCFREATEPEFKGYQQRVVDNARALADELNQQGFRLVAGGTDNHLLLVDLTSWNLTGARAALRLEQAGLTLNKNCIPFDTRSPAVTSGIRLGSPALTTRGMSETEMRRIAQWIGELLRRPEDEQLVSDIRAQVIELCHQFPIYTNRSY